MASPVLADDLYVWYIYHGSEGEGPNRGAGSSLSTSRSWKLGWSLGAVVVVIAAGLLLTIIALARRIVRQAGEIEQAIEGARVNTAPLFEVAKADLALDRIVRELRATREEAT